MHPGILIGRGGTLNNSIIRNNSGGGISDGGGGGGFSSGGDITLNSSAVSGNTIVGSGGGVFAYRSKVTLNSSTVDGNSSSAAGGGIYSRGILTLNSSTVSGNTAGTDGGGIYSRYRLSAQGSVAINHSTISNNQTVNGAGGGIWVRDSLLRIDSSILAANTANGGSPNLRPGTATLTLQSSLLGDNAGTLLVESHTPDANGNLIGSAAGAGVIDARLGPLADNGGPTKTHALLAGSPAIDVIPYDPPPVIAHDYQLNNSLADLLGGPSLTALGGNLQPTGYAFGANQGLHVSSALANPAEYSIEIVFRWNAITGGWYKIIDFHDLTSNVGLYTAGTGLYFLDRAFAPDRFTANTLAQLVITRDDATDTVRAYINGTLAWSFVDAAGEAVFDGPNQIMRFFQDDNVTSPSQTQAGFVDRVRIYNEVLSADDIQDINTPPPFPFPEFDQRGEPFARVRDGNGDGVPQVDMGAYELQSAANMPPVFTSPDAASVPENTTAVLTVTATDDLTPPQAITYAIVGGVDQARFSITTGGALTFKSPPDFEAPADANSDNVYLVIVEASDGSLTSLEAIVVTVTAVNDASPVFTSPSAVDVIEGTTAVTTLAATDADLPPQTVTFAIVGGADELKFTLTAGMLAFTTPPNFAMPADADGNNVYEVVVQADDGQGRTTLQTILVTVTSPPADYGDAPDAAAGTGTGNYQTRASDNGPRHTIVLGLRLGASVDADSGTLQNATATADDVDAALPDDEDGVSNPAADLALTIGAQPTVNLRATNTTGTAATLYGWIDYNADGVFDNATERASIAVPAGTNNGIVTLVFPTVPPGFHGTTYARFRLSTDPAAAEPTGPAADGEVEDYAVKVSKRSDLVAAGSKTVVSGINSLTGLLNTGAFGPSVASLGDLDGDGITDLAVGANGDDTGGPNRGAVYVYFMNADGTVKSSQKIAHNLGGGPTLANSDEFGISVACIEDLDGDGVNDLAVGGGKGVYVLFLRPDGTVKRLEKPSSTFSLVGHTVTSLGDLDGDGITDLAVGTVGKYPGGGVAIYFMNANGTVKGGKGINAPHPGSFERFGTGVASLGDIDGDGVTDLAVGAPNDTYNAGSSYLYVFFLNSDGTVKSSRAIAGSGTSVASLGDLDGDGITDIAVGSPNVSRLGPGSVSIRLLNQNGTTKSSRELGSSNGFGTGLAGLGDLNGDGFIDLAVGETAGSGTVHTYFLKSFNNSPVITSPSLITVPENSTALFTVTATDVDVPAQSITFAIADGADRPKFSITSAGQLSFSAPPDFDVPGDANGDNVYEVIVQASDGNGGFATQTIQVTVTPVNDNTPVFTSPDAVNVPENTTAVLTVTATDADRPPETITYALVGGSDQAKFNMSPNGVLTFKSPPDFEMPGDANGDNLYVLIVQASDGTRSDLQVVLVTVTNVVNEPLLAGDYNMSGTVDAADYVLWRHTLGASVPPFSVADGSGNGVIDQADYAVWRANFGRTLPPASRAFLPPIAPDTLRSRSSSYRPARRPGVPVAQADNSTAEQALAAWLAARPACMVDRPRGDEFETRPVAAERVSNPSREPVDALDLAFATL